MTLLLTLLVVATGWSVEPPIVGRPADFSGAIGGPFVVTMKVEPQTVAVEEPLTLTLRIVGPGNLKDIARPALAKLHALKQFAVDDLDDAFADGSPPSRTFRYRLRARTADAARIPPFKFVYFNPAIVPASRGYQTTYADAVEIQVTTAEKVVVTPSDLPQRIVDLRRRLAAHPHDEEARLALEALRSEVRYPTDDMRPRESSWFVRWYFRHRAAIAAGLATIAFVAFVRWWRHRRAAELVTAIVALIAVGLTMLGAALDWGERARNEETVVVARESVLRRGNGEEYPARIDAPLPPGAEVRRLHERNRWLQVELANGVVGWVAASAIIQ